MNSLQYYRDEQLFFHHSIDQIESDATFGMHAHQIYEIFYPLSARGTYHVEGNSYPLSPGMIYILRANEAHHIYLTGKQTFERMVLHFYPEITVNFDPKHRLLLPFTDRPLGQNNCFLLENDNPFIPIAFEALNQKYPDDYTFKRAILACLFSTLCTLPQLENDCIFDDSLLSDSKNFRTPIRDILFYINEHLADNLSLDLLSEHFFMSKTTLNTLFKKYTSSTVWNYIQTKRLNLAHDMIRRKTPATEACMACGFNDYSAFYRAYKNKFHMSPGST